MAAGCRLGGRRSRFERQQQRAERNRLARLDVDLEHLAGGGAGHLQRGLAGFELDDALVLGDDVALFDEQLQDIARVDAVAEVGKFDFGGHGSRVSGEWSGVEWFGMCETR